MVKKRLVCFGIGRIYQVFLELYDTSKAEIVALSDNNATKWNFPNFIEPSGIAGAAFDYIIVTSVFYEEIKGQLCGYGIDEERILNFYEIYKNLPVQDNYRIYDFLKGNVPASAQYGEDIRKIKYLQEKNLFLSAKNFANTVRDRKINSLEEAEFQVFSQFGEDGIIQWLIHNVDIGSKTFIEFGVENYEEANTRYLLMNNNWSGLVMDGSRENIDQIKNAEWFWRYDLTAVDAFITTANINQLITEAGFAGDIGILSIDLDGNDWWILNAITCVSPRILICEYNNIFGPDKKVTVPYDAEFVRSRKHYSNLYWGGSIAAFCGWARENGYYYAGSNSAGNNAFFLRKDCVKNCIIPDNAKVFVESKYRESRDQKGNLTYLKGSERLKCIRHMELYETESGYTDSIENIYGI